NIFALVFILFAVILLVSVKYVDSVTSKTLITIFLIIIGLSCFFISITWSLEWLILSFIAQAFMIAYVTPTLVKIASESVERDSEDLKAKLAYPISVIAWLAISGFLFWITGDMWVWRYLYIIVGSVNIAASLIIYT
ncbi:MAG: hypothetical protein ACW990_08535, partial [Promethearchaeota archaeon]